MSGRRKPPAPEQAGLRIRATRRPRASPLQVCRSKVFAKTLSIAAVGPDVKSDRSEQNKCQDGRYELYAPDPSRRALPNGKARQQHLEREFLHRFDSTASEP